MSRSPFLTLSLITASATWVFAQSGIEPPRRAVPPPPSPTADAAATDTAPAEFPAPVPVPEPPAVPTTTDGKPPIATGLSPAQIEAMKAKAAAARKAKEAAGGKPAGTSLDSLKSAVGGPKKSGSTTPDSIPNPNASGVPLSEFIPASKSGGALPNKDSFSDNSATTSDDGYVDVFANPTATVEDVLEDYEKFTGVTVVRAGNITGNVPIQVNPAARMKKDEYVDYLKVALMINGFGIHEYTPKLHIITVTGTASPFFPSAPPPEGHAVFTRAVDLPETEVFVNYFMRFDYISVQDATTILGAPQHQSGKITAVPNAGGILITESVPVVRSMIAIKEKIDVPSGEVDRRFVQLKLADAEEVAQIIQQIIQQQNTANKSGGGGGAKIINPGSAATQLSAQLNPGAPAGGAPAGSTGATATSSGAQTAPDGASVVVQADRRTNRILLSGKKSDIIYMEKLIHDFDVASEVTNLETYQLRYVSVVDFIDLAAGALEARGFGTSSGGSGGGAAGGTANRQASGNGYPTTNPGGNALGGQTGNNSRSSASNGRSGGGSSNSFGGSGSGSRSGGGGRSSGGGGGRSGGGGGSTLASPSSTTVGKTLLISDPQSNSIIVSGPPESREQIRLLIVEIDKHPRQVHIDCVIAEYTVGDTMEFGLDLLRKVDNISVGGKSVDVGGLFRNTSASGGIIDPATLTTIGAFPTSATGLNTYFQVGELINGYIKATEGTSKIKILQKPSIAMANNETGYISVGKQVPYPGTQQSSITNGTNQSLNSSIEYKDVLLSLEVTPLISSKNEVSLQITQINDNIAGSQRINNDDIPIISQQELNTKLIVPNGGIAILGGLTADSRNNTNSGAPFIARIPILKHIFGGSKKDDSRRELMIFIQPRIMETADEMLDVNAKEVQRNIIGPAAQNFIHPPYDTSNILLPQESGTVPFDQAGYPQQEEKPGFWKRLGNTFKRKTNVPAEPR